MKARLPEGMGRGPGNMQSMLRQAQKMQEDMAKLQEELDAREYTARSGGGAVTAVVDGKHRLKTLEIQPEVVDPEDTEMLADLVRGGPSGGRDLRGRNVQGDRRHEPAGDVLSFPATRLAGAGRSPPFRVPGRHYIKGR